MYADQSRGEERETDQPTNQEDGMLKVVPFKSN